MLINKPKVLITERIHPIVQIELEKAGFECEHIEQISSEVLWDKLPEINGLVVRSKIAVDRKLINRAKVLQFIGRAGSGMELIDIKYAQEQGIVCINAPEGNKDAVGEHALGMLLSLLHRISWGHHELKAHIWDRIQNRGVELGGKTVGIIGFGNTGSAFAERLRGLGVKILAYDKYKTKYGNDQVEACSLNKIYQEADILSLHIPLTIETFHWINNDFINRFHKNIYLINTSRGAVLHLEEVAQALEQGKIIGLCLDVLENEDLKTYLPNEWALFDDLVNRPNVVMTPHIAGVTHDSFFKIGKILAEKIIQQFG